MVYSIGFFCFIFIDVNIEITENEAVSRASTGLLTICRMCYDVRGKIVMVSHDKTKPVGLNKSFCDKCHEDNESCHACKKYITY
jgi:hypothetical protein